MHMVPSYQNDSEADALFLHENVFYMIHELSRISTTSFDQFMSSLGITRSQWWAMMHIYKRQGATQSELATIMQMGRASTGDTLARLESRNWIERRPDPKDTRVRRVYLAPGAVAYFEVIHAKAKVLFGDYMEGFTPEELQVLLSALSKMRMNAEKKRS